MNKAQAEALIRLKAEQEASRQYREDQRDIAAEARDYDGGATDRGKMRRWLPHKHNNSLAAAMLRRTSYLAVIFQQLLNEQTLKDFVMMATGLVQSFEDHAEKNSYLKVADTLDPELGIRFAEVGVAEEVATQLKQEITEVQMQDTILSQKFARFHGPFLEEKKRIELINEYKLRAMAPEKPGAPVEYAHCFQRVAEMHKQYADSPRTCSVRVFGVVSAPSTSKGLKVDVAEAGAEMTATDLAQKEAAVTVRVPPPQFNFVG